MEKTQERQLGKRGETGSFLIKDERKARRLTDQWMDGVPIKTIARDMACGPSTIGRAVVELGLPPRLSPIKAKPERDHRRAAPKPSGPTVTMFDCTLPVESRVTIDRPPRRCQWPLSDGRPWKFCDVPCTRLYCEEHGGRARSEHQRVMADDRGS